MDTNKRLKVLVIHHDTGASYAYTAIARSAGLQVSSCEDAGDVVGALGDNAVDVLISEFSPETGFTALRKIRQADISLPTILVTAHPVDHLEAMSLGVKMILTKPPDAVKLRESLAALATEFQAADFKVLFEFLERCQAAHRRK